MARRDDEDDDREYEDDYDDHRAHPGELMAHRGGMLLAFGIISLVLAFFSLIIACFGNVIGLPLGILAWIWGRKDLRAMDSGEMDPEGRGLTQAGFITGIIGTVLNALILVGITAFLLIYFVILGIMLGAK